MMLSRLFQILAIMFRVVSAILRNERFQLKDSLNRLNGLGGVYIKFLQVLILSLPPKEQDNYKELLSVYEHSAPDKIDILSYLAKVGARTDQFAAIEPKPFATGSFGQVYKAQLLSGEQVIIKVFRPSVIKYLQSDLRVLNLLCLIYGVFDKQKIINFRQIYRELKRTWIEESDYLREAEVAHYYYQAYQNHPVMVIPKTYLELSNRRVIVQEYMDGISLARLMEMQSAGQDAALFMQEHFSSNLYDQLHTVGFELLAKALVGDILQADPHPGNIILLSQNRVALIDFGMVAEVRVNRSALYELLLQYQTYYSKCMAIEEFTVAAIKYLAPELYAAIKEADKLLKPRRGSADLLGRVKQAAKATNDDCETLIQSFLEKRMIMKALFFVVNRGNRFGLSLDLKAITFLKATQTYLNLVGQFPNPNEVIGGVIDHVITYAQQNLESVVDTSGENFKLKPLEALEILSTWFDKMARNDPWLMDDLVGGYLK